MQEIFFSFSFYFLFYYFHSFYHNNSFFPLSKIRSFSNSPRTSSPFSLMPSATSSGLLLIAIGVFMIVGVNVWILSTSTPGASNSSTSKNDRILEDLLKELQTLRRTLREKSEETTTQTTTTTPAIQKNDDNESKLSYSLQSQLTELKTMIDANKAIEEAATCKEEESTSLLGVSVKFRTQPIRPWWRPSFPPLNQNPEKYLAFTPYLGGFNNDRMSFEIMYALAYVLNRTLVLPPKYYVYLLGFSDLLEYFQMEDLKTGVRTVSWEEFAQKFPELPADRIANIEKLNDVFIYNLTNFDGNHVWCHPSCPDKSTEPQEWGRMDKFAAGRTIVHDESESSKHQVIYFTERVSLSHFYALLYFRTGYEKMDAEVKELIRDHVHYPLWVVNLANQVISKLPKYYSAIHMRRGDFQYKEITDIQVEKIVHNTQNILLPHEPVYIATDERNETIRTQLFAAFKRAGHNVTTLDDFPSVMDATEKRFYGMIEQLVCTGARTFVGSRLSTFSGYITRLRMYNEPTTRDNRIMYTTSHYPDEYHTRKYIPEWWGWTIWAREYYAAVEPWEEAREIIHCIK